jgi:hypothetical protein
MGDRSGVRSPAVVLAKLLKHGNRGRIRMNEKSVKNLRTDLFAGRRENLRKGGHG